MAEGDLAHLMVLTLWIFNTMREQDGILRAHPAVVDKTSGLLRQRPKKLGGPMCSLHILKNSSAVGYQTEQA